MDNQIIRTATALFAQKGVSAVSMEQIAKEAGISEKSIYAEFEGKSKLLEECLKQEMDKIETVISKAQTLSQSALETLILTMFAIFKEQSGFCKDFHRNLNKYPVAHKHQIVFQMKLLNGYLDCFQQCVEDGYFISSEDIDHTAIIFIEEIGSLAFKYQYTMMKTLMESACTPKGLTELERIKSVIETKINQIINE